MCPSWVLPNSVNLFTVLFRARKEKHLTYCKYVHSLVPVWGWQFAAPTQFMTQTVWHLRLMHYLTSVEFGNAGHTWNNYGVMPIQQKHIAHKYLES